MSRPKKKPEELTDELVGDNPFVSDLVINARKKIKRVLDKDDKPDMESMLMESVPYCKVFEVSGGKKNISELSVRAKEMLLFLIHHIPSARDYMWINRVEYMRQNSIRSANTFKSAVAELSKASYIYPHATLKDVVWINPNYFFKGSRINRFPDNVKIIR